MKTRTTTVLRLLAAVAFFGAAAATVSADGPRGECGFVSCAMLAPGREADAARAVEVMATRYGVREFIFYDWFADYSTPVRGEVWTDAFFRSRPISRATLEAAIREVHRRGGRAWAYVQAVAAEPSEPEAPERGIRRLRNAEGAEVWHPAGPSARFPVYEPGAAWGRRMADRWAPEVRRLGFDGIHWDTLGRLSADAAAEEAGIRAFLRAAGPVLRRHGLAQNLNFVDLMAWDARLAVSECAFPYAEIWSRETLERWFAAMEDPLMRGRWGVVAVYPEVAPDPDEPVARRLARRREEAARHRLRCLVVGDGARRTRREYWPDTVPLSPEEDAVLALPR